MRARLSGSFLLCALTLAMITPATAASVPAKREPPHKSAIVSDVPLLLFQSIDQRLTLLDQDNRSLQRAINADPAAHARIHTRGARQGLPHARERRERLRTVNQLLAISSRAERTYRRRRQEYGARLFRDLHGKLVPLRSRVLRARSASTVPRSRRDERLINMSLLSVINQFQAISGGYSALACRPGTWACCQPKVVEEGNSSVRGCSWSCAAKLNACRGGCLGPRTPDTVVAVKNTPRRPIFAPAANLRAHRKGNLRKGEHASARTASSTAPGSD
jgi:hypothetical protein